MSPTTDNNDKPTTTEAVERTPNEVEKKKPTIWTGPHKRWVPIVVPLFVAVVAAGLTWLLTNIFQHKEEAKNPFTKVVELDDSTYGPAVWGKNFPVQYEQYKKTAEDTDGDFVKADPTVDGPREYYILPRIEMESRAQLMWRGYVFSVDCTEPRGHEWVLEDQKYTQHTQPKSKQLGIYLNCHASMLEVYDKFGNDGRMAGFHAMNSMSYKEAVQHASSITVCTGCHNPKTMELRTTRPVLMEEIKKAKALEGITDYGVNRDATNQEMRVYVCVQCHVEYYFVGEGRTLTFPWDKGLTAYNAMACYDEVGWTDYKHAESGAPILKAQYPDFETWSQGIYAANSVTCADCHMTYQRNGAAKVSNYQIVSPMVNDETINTPYLTYYHSTEAEMCQCVEKIQTTWQSSFNVSFTALKGFINDIKAAGANDMATEEQLMFARDYQRGTQFVVDYSFSRNGCGFHAPQHPISMLNQVTNWARPGRLALCGVSVESGVLPAILEKHMPNEKN